MEGIRKLARSSAGILKFVPTPNDRFTAISISPKSKLLECKALDIRSDYAGSFFRDDSTLKLIHVPSEYPGTIRAHQDILESLLEEIGLDPWVERLLRLWSYGYHHSTRRTSNGVKSHFLRTGDFTAMWTSSQDGSQHVTRGVIIVQEKNNALVLEARIPSIDRIVKTLALLEDESQSPLYLPFALSVDILRVREFYLVHCSSTIRQIEAITGHGSWGHDLSLRGERDGIKSLTARLGTALNKLASVYKHLNMVDLIWKDLETLSLDTADSETRNSDKSITDAIAILRQQSLQARGQAQYIETRVRSQSSVLFSLLRHEDAKVNIQTANASIELAAAARRDGSSMKTIAVLTMAFLPATFFAAFFSIPSLDWGDPDKFGLYWACTLPVTLATFLMWAGITQREAMLTLVRSQDRASRGKCGTTKPNSSNVKSSFV